MRAFEFGLEKPVILLRNRQPNLLKRMLLGEILTKDQIIPSMKATTRWEAIEELIDLLVSCNKICPVDQSIANVVKKRESSMSTGIGFGVGIPHASTDLIYDVVGAFGRSQAGVNFDALDNKPVNLVMLFIPSRAISETSPHAGQHCKNTP